MLLWLCTGLVYNVLHHAAEWITGTPSAIDQCFEQSIVLSVASHNFEGKVLEGCV